MNVPVVMWEETDPAEVARLKEALASATERIRWVVANYVRWEGPKMSLVAGSNEADYAHLYFWLCGYGDRMAVESRRQPVSQPPGNSQN